MHVPWCQILLCESIIAEVSVPRQQSFIHATPAIKPFNPGMSTEELSSWMEARGISRTACDKIRGNYYLDNYNIVSVRN